MAEVLWQWSALLAAAEGEADAAGAREVTGVSIDTRTLQPGDLFVALKDQRDGHEFVGAALAKGAAAALVSRDFALPTSPRGALIRVDDPLAALARIGRAARARTAARIIAVTGSVGKTGTKEALRSCLSVCGDTHASEKSYNNHWGVPLTLARMPADTAYGVFEVGMNHAGEISPLTRLVRPHAAIITTVGPVHIEFFKSEAGIADAKAEIFEGLEKGGVAIINRDNVHFERLKAHALVHGARILAFGRAADADARLIDMEVSDRGSIVTADIEGVRLGYVIGAPGAHYVMNSLAVLAAVKTLGGDLGQAVSELRHIEAPAGRGARRRYALAGGPVLLIDESYNANPSSVAAALSVMAQTPREDYPRRLVVLGDMRELGVHSEALHKGLQEPIEKAGIDLVLACGPHMAGLYGSLPEALQAGYAPASEGLIAGLIAAVQPGDVVMIKGSLGTRMAPLVEALKSHLAAASAGRA